MNLDSYEIEHIDLSKKTRFDKYDNVVSGKYLVFWWKDLAIGHYYLEPHKAFSIDDFENQVIKAIDPAMKLYAKRSNNKKAGSDVLQNDWTTLQSGLSEIFNNHLILELPQKVAVSLVICTRNRPEHLKQCLLQIKNLSCLPEEIIVVDNAPGNDDSLEIVNNFEGVTYVREPSPGLSFARNTGVKLAKQPIVAFTDDDVVVHPFWLYRVWQTFENSPVSAMTGLVIASKLESKAQVIFEKFWSFNRGFVDKIFDQRYYNAHLENGPPVWEIGAGANMAFRKDIFNQVGLFDELLGAGAAGCSEDSEMWFRILAKGFSIEYNPKAIVFHEHRSDMQGLKKQIFNYMRGFAAAAIAQQDNVKSAGYRNRVLKGLPYYYLKSMVKGFPKYDHKYHTLGVEVKGLISGILFYLKHKKRFLKFENQELK